MASHKGLTNLLNPFYIIKYSNFHINKFKNKIHEEPKKKATFSWLFLFDESRLSIEDF